MLRAHATRRLAAISMMLMLRRKPTLPQREALVAQADLANAGNIRDTVSMK
jgi:hypothetical protein